MRQKKPNIDQFLYQGKKHKKGFDCIHKTVKIIKKAKTVHSMLKQVCAILPEALQYPDCTQARIVFDNHQYVSSAVQPTQWRLTQHFESIDKRKGCVEIYYTKKFPILDEGPFLSEERDLIETVAELLSSAISQHLFRDIFPQYKERVKELMAINYVSNIIHNIDDIDKALQQICDYIPRAWQYAEHAAARIIFNGKNYVSDSFVESPWCQSQSFTTVDNRKGLIEVCYLKNFPLSYEGPFLQEERELLNTLALLIAGYINSIKAKDMIFSLSSQTANVPRKVYSQMLERKKAPLPPLQEFFDKKAIDKYIYIDMMRYKVREILFIATLYDAFTLESEDNFFEHFMGQIYQYSLFSLPRITAVSTDKEALDLLEQTHFDLVILMQGTDKEATIETSYKIKAKYPDLLVYMIINKRGDYDELGKCEQELTSIDNVFVWNGDSKIFFAIVKSIEDSRNVENDTEVGLVRIILLVEDAPSYYSRYLNMLYSIVFGQVQNTVANIRNELDKISKMRSRPKILVAKTYEEASSLFNKYSDYILCVISDVEFEKEGVYNTRAGFEFIRYIQSQRNNIPVLIQSANAEHEKEARKMNAWFINKYSDRLQQEFYDFITSQLAFGQFVFRNANGEPIAVAENIKDFVSLLATVPDESILYHAPKNQFSLWLMARAEILLAKTIFPISINHFSSVSEFRNFILTTINRIIEGRKKGIVIDFEEEAILNETNMVRLAPGSLGGKGRGLAFINTLIYNLDFSDYTTEINIRTPCTFVIGTSEFEYFIQKNNFTKYLHEKTDASTLKEAFLHGTFSLVLQDRLQILLRYLSRPIAVRSSGLFEDSLTQPFSGVFDTFLLPNTHPDFSVRLEQLMNAIKMVYASLFSTEARNYFHAINHKIEEEKMAVVIQEVVGSYYGNYYYPHISGMAQSYNSYAIGHMKAEEGFAAIALGLGQYVVNGEKSYRFSPLYPDVVPMSMTELVNNSQTEFLAIDLSRQYIDLIKNGENAGLIRLPISEAEKHGTLNHLASVYDASNDRIVPGIDSDGPRVLCFDNILRYNYIPLASTLASIINVCEHAFGSPIEIEYAIDLNKGKDNKPSFYLLQIKPLVGSQLNYDIDVEKIHKEELYFYSTSSLGNGRIDDLYDIIYVDPMSFNKLETQNMVGEIDILNADMLLQNKKYILIGPGRWGTRDPFIGIPVTWANISQAKCIVEMSMDNFPLDFSLGSHFFHNIISMNVGYCAVQNNSPHDFISWKKIQDLQCIRKTKYFVHVRCQHSLSVIMDGKKRIAILQ